MLKCRPLFFSLLLSGLFAAAAPTAAFSPVPPPENLQVALLTGPKAKQARAANAAEAARIAKRRHGGKILKVVTVQTEEGVRYRVKILKDNGRVITVVIRG